MVVEDVLTIITKADNMFIFLRDPAPVFVFGIALSALFHIGFLSHGKAGIDCVVDIYDEGVVLRCGFPYLHGASKQPPRPVLDRLGQVRWLDLCAALSSDN
jgi:hypothetical protein